MFATDDRVLVAVSRRQGLASPCGTCSSSSGYQADGLYIGLGIGEYSDDSGGYVRRFADRAGPARCTRSICATTTATTCRRRRGPPGACRARRAGCRSDTCSTRPRSTAATTSSSPGTTSTTRRPCCSATRCAGTSTTSPASCRCCRRRNGFPKKVKPLVRLTEREMAAWCVVRGHRLPGRGVPDRCRQQAPRVQGDRSTRSRSKSPGAKAAFYLGFLERMAPLLAGHSAAAAGDAATTCTRCGVADDRRGLRVLPARREGRRARTGARGDGARRRERRR